MSSLLMDYVFLLKFPKRTMVHRVMKSKFKTLLVSGCVLMIVFPLIQSRADETTTTTTATTHPDGTVTTTVEETTTESDEAQQAAEPVEQSTGHQPRLIGPTGATGVIRRSDRRQDRRGE